MKLLRESKPANANLARLYALSAEFSYLSEYTSAIFCMWRENFRCFWKNWKKAEKFIFLEYFIVEEGYMWGSVLEILKEKSSRGHRGTVYV